MFGQNNQVLGIGSGSTIVHAVQRIGMLLGCLLDVVLCGVMGVGVERRGRKWGTGLVPAQLCSFLSGIFGSFQPTLGDAWLCLLCSSGG